MAITGSYLECSAAGEKYRAFMPDPLPPKNSLALNSNDMNLYDAASVQLGRLDGLTTVIPDTSLFLYFYIRKEALLSSQIEGTQSSFYDILLYERNEKAVIPPDDIREVSNYIRAVNHGIARISEGFPLSLRLIREIHEILLSSGRGSTRTPGEFRKTQNWIGGLRPGNARYVPPPPERLMECLSSFENFLHDESTRFLIKIAMVHAQFETIHPFLDGNGRIGRLLITLMLHTEKVIREPLLYLSLYFKEHRNDYYAHLQNIRDNGAWEEWIRFFLHGVYEIASRANVTALSMMHLFDDHTAKIVASGAATLSSMRLFEIIKRKLIVSIPELSKESGITVPTVTTSVKWFETLGIMKEMTGRKRNKLYSYNPLLKILEEGTEPLP